MAINWDEIEKKAKKQSEADIAKNGGKKYKGSQSAGLAVNQTKKKTQTIPQNTAGKAPMTKRKGKTNNKHKLSAGAKEIQTKAIQENAFPQAVVRFNEKLLNDGILAPASIPYQIATGKKMLEFGYEPTTKSAEKGAKVGNFIGTAAAYGTGYGAAGKMIGKGATKVLATNAGKKATTKIAAGKIGQKYGQEAAERVAEGLARNFVGDATVGTAMNLSLARGEGLTGKDLAKDMAINAAFDAVLGSGFEFAAPVAKKLMDSIGDLRLERRIVDGKEKNVWAKTPQTNTNTYKANRSGSVNERTGSIQNRKAEAAQTAKANAKNIRRGANLDGLDEEVVTMLHKGQVTVNEVRNSELPNKDNILKVFEAETNQRNLAKKAAEIRTARSYKTPQEIPYNSQIKTPQEIPYAKRALAPEAQKKVFDAVEKRSGAKIAFADLPEGIDGTYQNGVITISNSSKNPAYTVLKHELTHHIETSGNYAELSEFIQNSMRDAGYDVDQSLKSIAEDYARMGKTLTLEEAQREFTAKFAEEYLFNSEKSIERLARENPNIFRQIYDWIVDTIRKIGASDETKFLIDAQRKYEKALRTAGKTDTGNISYHISENFSREIDKALNGTMPRNSQVKARDYTPKVLVENGVKDLPMLITQNHVRSIVYTDAEAAALGIKKKGTNYHGLGKELLTKAIDGMDDPLAIYKQGGDNYLVITQLKDNAGNDIIVPVKVNGNGVYNDVFIDENQIKTVYGKDNLENYLKENSLDKIYEKRGTALIAGVQFSGYGNSSLDSSIPTNSEVVNKKTKQFEIIQNTNKMTDDYHVGIRDVSDIKTFEEAIKDGESFVYGDFSRADAEKALRSGEVTVYSSKPIEQGGFVSTSRNMAEDYAGGGKIYSQKVKLNDVAWLNGDEGQYAKASFSTGKKLEQSELLARLRKTSESLYGETGNKYLQLPYKNVPEASKVRNTAKTDSPQQVPYNTAKARKVASEAPNITSDERWGYMLENAPGEKHARRMTDTEWEAPMKHAEDKFKNEHGLTQKQYDTFYGEPRTEIKESKKAQQYEHRKIREADKEIKEALGINKYSDTPYIKEQMDAAVEKMKNGSLSKAEREELFDEMFENGIVVDTEFATHYQDLKKTLRETPIKVSDSIRNNITDFADFRRRNMNKIRLNNENGVQADVFYDELREMYPELLPELNTPGEMVEKLAEVANNIKVAETKVSDDVDAVAIYDEAKKRFNEVMDNLEKETNIVKRYTQKHSSDITIDQMQEFTYDLGRMKREAEKVKNKVILNDEDRVLKDQLLSGRITPEALRAHNLNANNIIAVYEAEKPVYEMKKALKRLGSKTKESYEDTARGFFEGSENWKDKTGFNYARETPERNFVDVAGKEAGEAINSEFITPIHEHEAAATKMKNELRSAVKKLNISIEGEYDLSQIGDIAPGIDKTQKASEATLVQLYGEGLLRKEELEHLGADVGKIENAVATMRGIYNQLIEKANNELLRHGYEPIEFRKDYFPHFTEDRPDGILAKIGQALGIDVKKDELPTDIAGLTHTFRPGKKWFGHALQRTGKATEYDAVKGFDLYLEGISDVIYHTEDIQKLRALESELRFKYSDDGIKKRVNEVKESTIPDEVKNNLIDKIYEEGNTRMGSLATWLRNYTDQLAGKKSQFDRVFEQGLGRGIYNSTKAIENRIAANMVALNPGSWLTNFIPLVQAGEISPKYVIEGMAQTIGNRFHKVDGIADMSSFLTNRRGSDALWRSSLEKVQNALTSPMQMIDNFTSEALVRAKYAEQINKGVKTEDAMRAADRFAADIIADRSKGALPTMFNSKNPVSKIFTMYQVEVNNQWSHLMKDIPRSKENVAQVALAFTNFAIGAYIFNDVYERLVGRRTALDPISWVNDFAGDVTGKKLPNFTEALEKAMKGEGLSLENVDKKSGGGTITALGENIAQDIPFVGGLLEGGRVPISSALPSVSTLTTNAGNLITGDVSTKKAAMAIGKELAKPATYIIPPVGGGQIKKAVESTRAFAKGGTYGLDKDGNEQLKFAVDKTPLEVAKGVLFGQYAIGNSGDYVDSGFKMLSKDKTRAYKALTETGMKNTEAEDFIRLLPTNKKSEMREAIMNSSLTAKQKNAVGKILDEHSPDYSTKNSYSYSQMSDSQKKAIDNLKKSGISQKTAERIYNAQKDYSSQAEKVNALLEAGYKDAVLKAMGMGEKGIAAGKALHTAGLENVAYQYTKKNADINRSGNVSLKEAKRYLDKTSYTRAEKFALTKALTGCADKNNPYR